jgi:hypothetical protein
MNFHNQHKRSDIIHILVIKMESSVIPNVNNQNVDNVTSLVLIVKIHLDIVQLVQETENLTK